jgi:hypothetical protein
MGLLDMLGVGGGSVSIQLSSTHATAGGQLSGSVGFAGGKRPQDVTRLTLKLVVDETSTRQVTVNGQPTWQPHTDHRDVIPAQVLGGPFQSVPGQTTNFPFQFAIPPGIPNSTPQRVKYRLVASADIDNAVDPGANVEVQVSGGVVPGMAPGAAGAMPMPGYPGAVPQPGYPGAMPMPGYPGAVPQPGYPGAMPQPGFAGAMPMPGYPGAVPQPGYPGAMPQPGFAPAAAFALGTHVLAQWQDGHFHAAVVTAHREGMIGVDWTDPRLGASSWVAPHQLQPAQPQFAAGHAPPPPAAAPVAAGYPAASPAPMGGKFASAAPHDPHAKGATHDSHAKGAPHDPYAKGGGHDGHGKGSAASHLPVGAPVTAQHGSGQWHPARVAAHQNGMVGVDWDDPRLGASSWVQPNQVVPR